MDRPVALIVLLGFGALVGTTPVAANLPPAFDETAVGSFSAPGGGRDGATAFAALAQEGSEDPQPGKGDDLARIRAWRAFLDRAHRAFFATHRSTAAVKAKIREAEERIAELRSAPDNDAGGRSDITGDVAFLERAHQAFTFAHMNTAAVKKWLREAREETR